jgi:hypothetical protein
MFLSSTRRCFLNGPDRDRSNNSNDVNVETYHFGGESRKSIGEDGDPISLLEPQSDKRIGELAGPIVLVSSRLSSAFGSHLTKRHVFR